MTHHSSHGSYSSHTAVYSGVTVAQSAVPHVTAKPVVASGSGTLRVSVPTDAKVFVNDNATSSTGADRHYVSNGLESGQSYTYRVRVEYQQNGQTVVENKVATLTMNDDIRLSFGSEAVVAADEEDDDEDEGSSSKLTSSDEDEDDDDDGSSTKLTLHVPADARVTLAGSATRQTGVERQYLTTQLPAGQAWENYVVSVELDRGGQTLSQQRVITLRGGEAHELAFDFASPAAAGPKLAAAN